MKPLLKNSPLSGVYEKTGASLTEINGWMMASAFSGKAAESKALEDACVLGDWSHIGKITVSGANAGKTINSIFPKAKNLGLEKAWTDGKTAVLRHLRDSFTILCQTGGETDLAEKFSGKGCTFINQTGGNGCLVLAGAKRDGVMARSSAMNLRRDKYPAGSVIQSGIHAITATIYRTESKEIILCARPYCESLCAGFQDVGKGQGLVMAGLDSLPVFFDQEAA